MRLGDIIEIKHGYAFSGENIIEEDNNVVLVTPGNFRIGGGFQEKKCKFFDGEIPQDYVLKAGDFIVTMTDLSKNIDTLGYSAWVPKSEKRIYLHNQRIGLVSLKNNKCDRGYIYWLMRTHAYQRTIANTSTGATVHHTSPSKIYEYECEVPDISIQHRIATILSRYDSLIENYQKQIKLLEEAAQRLYKEWFVDLHFPGHENTKIVDGVPEGWEKKTLGELISYVRGKSYSSNEISDEGCIMVNLKNIQAFGGYKRDAEKRFIGEYKPEQTLQKGDLVMGVTDMTQERRLVGHVALIPDFNEPATFSMDLIKIIPYSIPIIYLYCAMRYGGISKQISPLANGVNVLHLKPDTIMGTMMVVPRKDLIERFCPFVEEMTNKILKNQSQIRLLTEARDRLLPKLMSGEIKA